MPAIEPSRARHRSPVKTLLAAGIRSGLVETIHDGAVAIVSADGELIGWSGDIDRPFYLRSSAKPFQAMVAQQAGAQLRSVELALASASHDGDPVHVTIVESMLDSVGLSSDHLICPPEWPQGAAARHTTLRSGHLDRQRVWHSCSGKHASWLMACQTQAWPLQSYLDPKHALQKRIFSVISDLGELEVTPVGVDGCGAPVLRTTARAMALLYARLGSMTDLRSVFESMHRYPALFSGVGNCDAAITTALNAVAKGGADGCLGVALERRLGIAAKAWDGSNAAVEVGAIAALEVMGCLSPTAAHHLQRFAQPPVSGGDRIVGKVEPRLELLMT